MENINYDRTIVDYASDVIDMYQELLRLKAENIKLKKEVDMYYQKTVQEIKDSYKFMGEIFHIVLNKGDNNG